MTPEQEKRVNIYRKCSLNSKMVMAQPNFVFMLDLVDEQVQELEQAKERIAELNIQVLSLAGKDLSTAMKLTRRMDRIIEAGNGLIFNDGGVAQLYRPAVNEWNRVLSNTKGEA